MTLPSFVVCPHCHGALDATLTCRSCGRAYREEDGIPRLLDPDAPGLDAKLRELAAWPVLAREQGWYEVDDRVDAALPYLNSSLGWEDRAWGATEHGFRLLLERFVRPATACSRSAQRRAGPLNISCRSGASTSPPIWSSIR